MAQQIQRSLKNKENNMKSSFPKLQALSDAIESLETSAQYVTIRKASEVTGYSEDAIRNKITTGIWPENLVWKWGPDGVQLIILKGYNKWAKQLGKVSSRGRRRSESSSTMTDKDTSRH